MHNEIWFWEKDSVPLSFINKAKSELILGNYQKNN